MVSRIQKIISRFLLENDFKVKGNTYKFIYVKPYDPDNEMSIKIGVNVIMPDNKSSYLKQILENNIEEIFINLSKYVNGTLSYYLEELMVNGETIIGNAYVSPEKQKQILSTLNSRLNNVTIKSNDVLLNFNIGFSPGREFFYRLSDVILEFYFNLKISHLTKNGVDLIPNLNKIDDLSGALTDLLNDDDNFRGSVEDVVYEILEPEIRIGQYDLYYGVLFYVNKIDGLDTDSYKWGVKLDRSFFT